MPIWRDETLDYRFAMTLRERGGDRTLPVDGYADGRRDWWSLDAGERVRAGRPTATQTVHRVPMPVRFAGQAADRLFECEHAAVNFGPVSVGPTSITALLMIEYVLASSNDCYQLPITLHYGHAHEVLNLTVTDTFGQTAPIGRAARGSAGWSMFEVTRAHGRSDDHSLFVLPGVAAAMLEGPPIEEVALFRDELANVAWAAERIVPGVTVTPIARPAPSRRVVHPAPGGSPPDAAFLYRLQTGTPTNWYPLTAEGDAGQVSFRLRRLRYAFVDGDAALQPAPGGALLTRSDGAPFRLREQALPRSGLVLTRSFQMARDAAGHRHIWLGRRKKVGGGEGSSMLAFDELEPTN